MPKPCLRLLWVLSLLLAGGCAAAEPGDDTITAADLPVYPSDPARYEKAIERFEAADEEAPPPKGAVLCIGSSSLRGWHGHLEEDLEPLTVIPRGFGGSTMNDVLHYMNRIVMPYEPRAVLLYEGDNDIAAGLSPEDTAQMYRVFFNRLHAELPDCRVYVLSVKPSIRRWAMWPEMAKTNQLLKAMCEADDRLTYIDIATPMLNDEGEPRGELLVDDNLHMNRAGYEVWRDAVRPILVEREREHEPVGDAGEVAAEGDEPGEAGGTPAGR